MNYKMESAKYVNLYNSFRDSCSQEGDNDKYYATFNNIANELSKLPIKRCFVDIGHDIDALCFNINMGKGLFLSLMKVISINNNEDVLFTLKYNDDIMIENVMTVSDLVDSCNKAYKSINE